MFHLHCFIDLYSNSWSFFHSSGINIGLFEWGGAHALSKTRLVFDRSSKGFLDLLYAYCLCRSHLTTAAKQFSSSERLVIQSLLRRYVIVVMQSILTSIPCSRSNYISPGVSPIHYFVKGRVERQYGCREVPVLKQGQSDFSAAYGFKLPGILRDRSS